MLRFVFFKYVCRESFGSYHRSDFVVVVVVVAADTGNSSLASAKTNQVL